MGVMTLAREGSSKYTALSPLDLSVILKPQRDQAETSREQNQQKQRIRTL